MSDSYLNAPQTLMLATHCACCGRPLCDAHSVEVGIGPECRSRLGLDTEMSDDVRKLCNQLTRAASLYAQQGRVSEVRKCAQAIRVIGLTELAARIDERFVDAEKKAKIFVSRINDKLYVRTPFRRGSSKEFVAAWRAIPGRRWDSARVANELPLTSRPALWKLLLEFFPGEYGESDEGVFRIPVKVKP